MSIRFYNPPGALLSKGTKEGVEIGGALCVIAMDKDHNLHVVKNLFSELSWGEFWKEKDIADQIENITVKHEDNATLFDSKELLTRITDSFAKIRANKWVFFGIGNFESNSFMDAMIVDLDYEYVEKLLKEHKRVRDLDKFPKILSEFEGVSSNVSHLNYISSKFTGNFHQLFHYNSNTSLYSIFEKFNLIIGNTSGIICTAQGAANFYILAENIHRVKTLGNHRNDPSMLEKALLLMKKDVIFPISWFKIDIGLSSLKSIKQWDEIKTSNKLKAALQGYFKYCKNTLKKEHDLMKEKKKNPSSENKKVNVSEMSNEEKLMDLKALNEMLNLDESAYKADRVVRPNS